MLRKLFVLVFSLCCFSVNSLSQNQDNRDYSQTHTLNFVIPTNLKINDKIFLINQTSQYLYKVDLLLYRDGLKTTIGSCVNVAPGYSYKMLSTDNNGVKKYRGKQMGLRIKTLIYNKSEGNDETVCDGFESNDKEFDIELEEDRHDLYIYVYNRNQEN